ncbi:MAG: bifunctional aspartate kinase/homoserine dehydrogenase I [Sphingobacteriales bacterium]|jgi:aspartokinase/homoserine dehydrogenase 1|nr:bifunctional aspartate kinase/homoserine dehydrogenase I [Sphingobacteriales bacterium]
MQVLKFGGSSVASATRIQGVASIVRNQKSAKGTAVVFSAFGGVTDDLIRMSRLAARRKDEYIEVFDKVRERHTLCIRELGLRRDKALYDFVEGVFGELHDILHGIYLVRELSTRTLDFVSGQGEVLSSAIISAYFRSQGMQASFVDARELIRTDETFGSARVDFNATNTRIREHFRKLKGTAVITGFIGSTHKGEMTTLGRGGSDYSAAIFGAALNATEIQIWTDVDGVMTADPRKVKKAFSVPSMTYDEAMELSHFGAKVIHPPTIQPALDKKIPLRIKNTFHPEHPGTFISVKPGENGFLIKGISSIDQIALLTLSGSGMVGVTGISARLFGAIHMAKVNVILITQGSSEHTISFAVRPEDAHTAKTAIEEAFALEMKSRLIDKVRVEEGLSVVAVIGENMRNQPGVSGKLFNALGRNGISVVATAQGSSELNISVVIQNDQLSKALNTIHQAFFLSGVKTLSVYLVGTGLIGGTLMKQIASHLAHLRQARSLDIVVAGISNSRNMLFNASGVSLSHYSDQVKEGEKADLGNFIDRMIVQNQPNSVLVDCTGGPELAKQYARVLGANISIVTPNKVANSGTMKEYSKLREIMRRRNVNFLYETNVGAGLPVINTLNDLITSGDRIIRIEAVLSGTLSYIFNTFNADHKFSNVVKEAKRLGYTEPDPRVDLSGLDVARKLLILARETGMQIELKDIAIEQILPAECMKAKSVDEFFKALERNNAVFEKRRASAAAKGKVLRFIAKLDKGKASIRLEEVDTTHPFYNLSGSDNIISFTTERYNNRPLVVKGPGAGAEVTAAGVFAEIISLSKYLD